jgi:type IV pilus biogenesis protein CpaD/CtpE
MADAYTYLNLGSSNEYNIKASMYNSADILQSKPGQAKDGKLEGSFNK